MTVAIHDSRCRIVLYNYTVKENHDDISPVEGQIVTDIEMVTKICC